MNNFNPHFPHHASKKLQNPGNPQFVIARQHMCNTQKECFNFKVVYCWERPQITRISLKLTKPSLPIQGLLLEKKCDKQAFIWKTTAKQKSYVERKISQTKISTRRNAHNHWDKINHERRALAHKPSLRSWSAANRPRISSSSRLLGGSLLAKNSCSVDLFVSWVRLWRC